MCFYTCTKRINKPQSVEGCHCTMWPPVLSWNKVGYLLAWTHVFVIKNTCKTRSRLLLNNCLQTYAFKRYHMFTIIVSSTHMCSCNSLSPYLYPALDAPPSPEKTEQIIFNWILKSSGGKWGSIYVYVYMYIRIYIYVYMYYVWYMYIRIAALPTPLDGVKYFQH